MKSIQLVGAQSLTEMQKTELKRSSTSLAGAVLLSYFWKKHRVWGFFLGAIPGRILGTLLFK